MTAVEIDERMNGLGALFADSNNGGFFEVFDQLFDLTFEVIPLGLRDWVCFR